MEAYKNILVVIDEDDFVTKAIVKAANLIQKTHGRMTILLMEHHARLMSFSSLFSSNLQTKMSNRSKRVRLNSMIKMLIKKGVKVSPELQICDSCEDVLHEANIKDIDTIIISASTQEHKLGFHGSDTGSTLLGKSPTSLLIVKDNNWQPFRKILSAIELLNDKPEHQILTKKVLEESQHFTQLLDGECHTVDCYRGEYVDMSFDMPKTKSNQETHQALMKKYCRDYHLSIEKVHMSAELPEQAIIHVAKEIDSELIILGDCGHRGILNALSTHVSVEVLKQVHCDMLVLKP